MNFETVDVKFTQGTDTKTQAKLVIPGKWNKLENCSLSDNNTPTRRDGVATLIASANGNGLALHNKELLHFNDGTVSSVTTAGTDALKAVSGRFGWLDVEKEEVGRSGEIQQNEDIATGNGFTCYVWCGYPILGTSVTDVSMTLVDETTGTKVLANQVVRASTTVWCPRVVFQDNAFFIVYRDGNSLYCRVVATSAPTVLGVEVALVTTAALASAANNRNIDACALDSAGTATTVGVVLGHTGAFSVQGVPIIRTGTVPSTTGLVALMSTANCPIATINGFSISAGTGGGNTAGVFVLNSNGAAAYAGISGVVVDSAFAAVVAPQQILNEPAAWNAIVSCVDGTSTGWQLFWGGYAPTATTFMPIRGAVVSPNLSVFDGPATITNSATTNGTGTNPAGPGGPYIASKPFQAPTAAGFSTFLAVDCHTNFMGLAATTRSNNQQNVLFVLDVTGSSSAATPVAARIVAKALYGFYSGQFTNNLAPVNSTRCSVASFSDGSFGFACAEVSILQLVSAENPAIAYNLSKSAEVRLTFSPRNTIGPLSAKLGETTYFAGGQLTGYDGLELTESGFHLFPEGINVEVVNAAGTMTDGVHQVVVVAESVDNAGQRWQSAPCLAVSGTAAGGNDAFRVRVPSLLLSMKSDIRFVPYITVAGGTTFYRYGSVAAGNGGTLNDTTGPITTLADLTQPDSVIQGGELLDTQPNATETTLPSVAPGPVKCLAAVQNRLFFGKADQPGRFGFSQRYRANVGLQFSDDLGGTIPDSLVAIAGMDEKVLFFGANAPFVLFGDGPDASGANSGYRDPQRIPTDVGCSDAKSVLEIPAGLMFKSAKGWYLLGRDLVTRFIGDGVSDFDTWTVLSAEELEDRQEARFTVSAPGGNSNVTLVYDYMREQWSTTIYKAWSGASSALYEVCDAVFWTSVNAYVTVGLAMGLNQDTPGVYLDAPGGFTGGPIITTGRTAWLRPSIINGYQRVRRAFLTGTSPARPTSTLVTQVYFDDAYQTTSTGAYAFTADYGVLFPVSTYVSGQSIDFRHKMQFQKCKSVAFEFTETPLTSAPAGVNFQSLSLELGLKKGVLRLPAAQSL